MELPANTLKCFYVTVSLKPRSICKCKQPCTLLFESSKVQFSIVTCFVSAVLTGMDEKIKERNETKVKITGLEGSINQYGIEWL